MQYLPYIIVLIISVLIATGVVLEVLFRWLNKSNNIGDEKSNSYYFCKKGLKFLPYTDGNDGYTLDEEIHNSEIIKNEF